MNSDTVVKDPTKMKRKIYPLALHGLSENKRLKEAEWQYNGRPAGEGAGGESLLIYDFHKANFIIVNFKALL